MKLSEIEWVEDPKSPDDESVMLPSGMRLVVSGNESIYGDGSKAFWYVDAGTDDENYLTILSGTADGKVACRYAAYDAWRAWAKAQAELAGFTVTES